MNDITALQTTSYNTSYLPLPDLATSIPCPASDRCDTTGVPVPPPTRSAPAVSRFCPTLGWWHLVKSVTHRAAVSVALAVPIVLNVPDMWSRAEDNLLEQTIEIPDHLTQQYRERHIPTAFLTQLTWVFLYNSVTRVPFAPSPPPVSRMYTGTSVLSTPPIILYLRQRD